MADIKVGDTMGREDNLDVTTYGVKKDPSKEYRWVAPNKTESRKNRSGYTFTRRPDGSSATEGRVKYDELTLMERPKELADQSRKRKDAINRQKQQDARSALRNRVEAMSSRYGVDLHKNIKDED